MVKAQAQAKQAKNATKMNEWVLHTSVFIFLPQELGINFGFERKLPVILKNMGSDTLEI